MWEVEERERCEERDGMMRREGSGVVEGGEREGGGGEREEMEGEMRDGGRDGRVEEGGKTRHRDGSVVQRHPSST